MRIMGLDYGAKTVGVAISDAFQLTAQGITVLWREKENHLRKTLAEIEKLIVEYEVDKIVVGLPLNMDDSEGDRAKAALSFKDSLERRTGLPVIMWDERLTTLEAYDILNEAHIKKEDRKKYVDKIAAVLILQDYLNAQQSSKD